MPARSFSARGWRRVVKKLLLLYLIHQYLWCYCYCDACTYFSLINLHPSFQKKKTGNSWQGSYVSCADNHVGRGGGEGREQWSGQCLPLTYVGKTMLSHTNFNIIRVGTAKPAHVKHVCWAKHGVKAGGTVHPSLYTAAGRGRERVWEWRKGGGGNKRGVVCLDFWPLCWKMGNGCPTAESLSWCNRQDYFLPWLLFWPGLWPCWLHLLLWRGNPGCEQHVQNARKWPPEQVRVCQLHQSHAAGPKYWRVGSGMDWNPSLRKFLYIWPSFA